MTTSFLNGVTGVGVEVPVSSQDPMPVTGSVSVTGTPAVTISGTPSVSVSNTPSVTISGTPAVTFSGSPAVSPAPYPSGATAITAASGNVANASGVATLAGTSGKTTYISGFEITATGATLGSVVSLTVVGTISTTLTYTFAVPAGVLLAASPLLVTFDPPIPASAANTSIVVTLPALGSGNTNATVVAHGFQL